MEGGRRHYCKEKEISTAVWQEKGMFLYALDCVKVIWGQAGELSVLYFLFLRRHMNFYYGETIGCLLQQHSSQK